MSQARRRRVSPSGVRWVSVALVATAFGLGFGLGRWSADGPPVATPDGAELAPIVEPPVTVDVTAAFPALSGVAIETEPSGPRIALVIDDLGRSVATVESLRALGVALSYAVLPFESHTRDVAAYLGAAGLEILCHVPMEARRGVDPGPGALVRSMSALEIRQATERALASVPLAVGVNNHMGSAFSEDAEAMARFLEVVGERGLYFLDSRTSAATAGYRVAKDLGIGAVERNVFLDRSRSPELIRGEFRRALELASAEGPAVVIGHPYDETLEVLRQEVPRALDRGFRFVTVGELVRDR